MASIGQKENMSHNYLTRDRIQTVFNSSIPELVMAQGRLDGFIVGQEINYQCEATPDSLLFDTGVVEWKQSHAWGRVEAIIRFDTGLLQLALAGESLNARAFAANDEDAKSLLDMTRQRIPASKSEENEVEITFWRHHDRNGPIPERRTIVCPSWDEIEDNYAGSTQRALQQLLLNGFDTSLAGKLVLWHGEPGTGKTFALRSWARMCRDWMQLNYILDPDVFFGRNANYMCELLMRTSEKKLTLFVAEDTGELLARDAKQTSGQGLSRLLYLCDGLIGQGLRIMFLITTNEDLGSLHPAISRPGRCHANIGFEAFSEQEARAWLHARGIEKTPRSRSSIAQLYSMIESSQILSQKPKVLGFV